MKLNKLIILLFSFSIFAGHTNYLHAFRPAKAKKRTAPLSQNVVELQNLVRKLRAENKGLRARVSKGAPSGMSERDAADARAKLKKIVDRLYDTEKRRDKLERESHERWLRIKELEKQLGK
jgi:seryl-tRNA synthetase